MVSINRIGKCVVFLLFGVVFLYSVVCSVDFWGRNSIISIFQIVQTELFDLFSPILDGSSSSDGSTSTVGPFGSYIIASLGALTAYGAWSWYQSPYLVAEAVSKKTEIYANRTPIPAYRLSVKNIGNKSSTNCRARIWMKGENPDKDEIVIVYFQLGWANQRATVVTGQTSDILSSKTVGVNETAEIELFRQKQSHLITMRWGDSGRETVTRIHKEHFDYNLDDLGESILIDRSDTESSDKVFFEHENNLENYLVKNTNWETLEFRITTDEGQSITEEFEICMNGGEADISLIESRGVRERFVALVRRYLP